MAVLIGLAAALGFGGGDFLGGLASKRSTTASVLLVVQCVGLIIAFGWVAVDGKALPPGDNLLVAAGAGVSGVTGLGLLFRGLATGRMGVVAPVSAVIASTAPVLWGAAQGERPSAVAWTGVGVAIVAVGLIARTPDRDADADFTAARPLALGFAAGAAFGVAVILFSEAAQDGGFWPLVFARVAAVPAMLGVAAFVHRAFAPARSDVPTSLASGVLDVTGNAALLVAFRRGLTSLVAPVAALYPAATVILARIVLKETLTRLQFSGLVLALTGLVLIGAG